MERKWWSEAKVAEKFDNGVRLYVDEPRIANYADSIISHSCYRCGHRIGAAPAVVDQLPDGLWTLSHLQESCTTWY